MGNPNHKHTQNTKETSNGLGSTVNELKSKSLNLTLWQSDRIKSREINLYQITSHSIEDINLMYLQTGSAPQTVIELIGTMQLTFTLGQCAIESTKHVLFQYAAIRAEVEAIIRPFHHRITQIVLKDTARALEGHQ